MPEYAENIVFSKIGRGEHIILDIYFAFPKDKTLIRFYKYKYSLHELHMKNDLHWIFSIVKYKFLNTNFILQKKYRILNLSDLLRNGKWFVACFGLHVIIYEMQLLRIKSEVLLLHIFTNYNSTAIDSHKINPMRINKN